MKEDTEKTDLDKMLYEELHQKTASFDFDRWAKKYPREVDRLKTAVKNVHPYKSFNLWRTIMKSSYTKYGMIAASLLIAFVFLFPGDNGISSDSLVWADVQQKMQEKGTVFATGTKTIDFFPDSSAEPEYPHLQSFVCQVEMYGSREYGYIEKIYYQDKLIIEIYLQRSSRIVTLISHEQKRYFSFKLPEEFMKNLDIISVEGVTDFFTSGQVRNIGLQTIRGKELIGFEKGGDVWFTREIDSKILAFLFPVKESKMRLWVDPKTSLPVFEEVEMIVGKGIVNHFMETTVQEFMDQVQWDVDLKESFFVPVIPEGYQIFGMPEMKAAAAAGTLGIAAAIPCFLWIRRKRRKKQNHKK
jgi:hypothetical protein